MTDQAPLKAATLNGTLPPRAGPRIKSLPLLTSYLLIGLIPGVGLGQTTQNPSGTMPEWQKAAGGKIEFDVAAVRESAPGTPYESTESLDEFDGPSAGSFFRANAPIMAYLLFAYKISDSSQAQKLYSSLPGWAIGQFFHVEGRAEGVATRDQLRLMVQSLLEARFKLILRREVQQGDKYLLVQTSPGRLGAHLTQHPNEPCLRPSDPGAEKALDAARKESSRQCGARNWQENAQEHLQMTDVDLAEVSTYLSGTGASLAGGTMTPRSGVDGTGLTGRFDLDLLFTPEPRLSTTEPSTSDDNLPGPKFNDAMRDQLGLKLIGKKGPVEMLVIDHLEKPSPD